MGYWLEESSQKSLKIPCIELFDSKSQVYCITKKYIYEEAFNSCSTTELMWSIQPSKKSMVLIQDTIQICIS